MGTAREAMPSAAFGMIAGRRQAGGMGRVPCPTCEPCTPGPKRHQRRCSVRARRDFRRAEMVRCAGATAPCGIDRAPPAGVCREGMAGRAEPFEARGARTIGGARELI